jgi:hypothetical protein
MASGGQLTDARQGVSMPLLSEAQPHGEVAGLGRPVTHNRRALTWLAAAGAYLAISLLVWWNVWSGHPATTATCGCGDSSLFTWFIEWPAYALAHGLDPFHSTAMGYPGGVNLLSNTSELAVGTVLAPVTWLFGPVASLNVAVTLAPVLSALAMFFLLRRWVSWAPAAFVGGLLYGFSPFVLGAVSGSYLMVGVAVVPPLVVAGLDELMIRQHRSPVVTGVGLGLLVVLQFFIGTEALAIMVLTGALGVLMIVAFAAVRTPTDLRSKAHHAVTGMVAGGVTSVVLLAYPAWYALAGPSHLSEPIWPGTTLRYSGAVFANFFDPTPAATSQTALNKIVGGYQGTILSHQYVGWGTAAVLVVGLLLWRRDLRLWLFGAVTVVTGVLSLGQQHGTWLPWQALSTLPLLENIIPSRFLVETYLAVAVMVALIVDHAYHAASGYGGRQHRGLRSAWWAGGVGIAVAAVALVPIADYLAPGLPFTTQAVALPTWFRSKAPHLTGHQVVMVFPAPFSHSQSALTWQAVDHDTFSMAGQGGPGGQASRAGPEAEGLDVLSDASVDFGGQTIGPEAIAAVRRALDGWGVTTVVIPDQPSLPTYDQIVSVTRAAALMTAATGTPPEYRSSAWVWMGVQHSGPSVLLSRERFTQCTEFLPSQGVPAVDRATSCVLAG